MGKFCYWSVADGEHGLMMRKAIQSARNVGVSEDFHIWTDVDIPDAITHDCKKFDKKNYLFKFHFLKNEVSKLDYDYFVFLDADSYFVRKPEDIISQTQGDPIHVCLESDCNLVENSRGDWWGCPLGEYVKIMREKGVRSKSVFNTNAGLWIVKKDIINTFYDMAIDFWEYSKSKGYVFTEEAPLAYVGHMLVGDVYKHTLKNNARVWASDWIGIFNDVIPHSSPFEFEDYMSGNRIMVNPSIVHCMRSKNALIKEYNK